MGPSWGCGRDCLGPPASGVTGNLRFVRTSPHLCRCLHPDVLLCVSRGHTARGFDAVIKINAFNCDQQMPIDSTHSDPVLCLSRVLCPHIFLHSRLCRSVRVRPTFCLSRFFWRGQASHLVESAFVRCVPRTDSGPRSGEEATESRSASPGRPSGQLGKGGGRRRPPAGPGREGWPWPPACSPPQPFSPCGSAPRALPPDPRPQPVPAPLKTLGDARIAWRRRH